MVKSFGASYSIVGHSERRAQGETDEMVRAQLGHAAAAGITPILCIGESEPATMSGHTWPWLRVSSEKRSKILKKTGAPKLVVAYERCGPSAKVPRMR